MKKLLSLVTMLLFAVTSFAYDACIDGIYYSFSKSNATVTYSSTSTTEYTGSITIPATVTYSGTTYKVTSIDRYAFRNCSGLSNVTIPEGVTSIGSSAFYNCSGLSNVTIPEGVTSIGTMAFRGCSGLTSITIPSSVTSLHNDAFEYCSGLTSIKVDEGNTVFDCRDNCNAIIRTSTDELVVGCMNTIIPEGIKSISEVAFRGCTGLTSITIPSSVTSLGFTHTFLDCKNIASIKVDAGNTVFDSRDNCNAIIETASNMLIAGCMNTVIPEGVSSIWRYAFYGCSGLTNITIPESVIDISERAFGGCSGLTSITIPNSVTNIGEQAFYNCSGLTSVTIPNSITSIGSYAFFDCSKLTSINIPNSVTSIGERAFSGCSGLTSINIPNSVTSIGKDAFYNCSGLTSVTIGSGVTSIGSSAFYGCSGLQKVVASDIVAWYSINFNNETANPLYNAHHLYNGNNSEITNLFIPDGVTSIRNFAFSGCTGLTSVTIPNGVTTIGDNAFADCENLTDIELPKTLLSIGSYAFKNCKSFTKIEIPEGVSDIPEMAFSGCINVKNIKIPSSVKSIGNYAFSSCWSLTEIVIPEGVKTIGNSVFVGSRHDPETREPISGLQIITLPSTLESMGLQALGYLAFLKTLHSYIKEPFNAYYVFDEVLGMYGNNATLYIPKGTKDKYLATNGWKIFANIVEMSPEIEPIEEETVIAFNNKDYIVDNTPVDLNNTVINDMYISMDNKSDVNNPDGFYDSNENCIVINKATSASAIETAVASDLGSSDFINNYTGIVIEVNGKGSLTINAQTIGNNKLAVKIGSDDVRTYTQVTKGDVTINYDVTENTYVYIYAVDADNQQQSLSMDITDTSDNAVKVYSVTVTPDATAIETVPEATIPAAVFGKVYSIDGKQLSQPQKGLNILKMSDGTIRKVVK